MDVLHEPKIDTCKGSAHVIIIICLVVALLAALGVVFYQNFIATKPTSKTDVTSKVAETGTTKTTPKNTIEVIAGSDMNRYVNNEYGFEFQFPKQAYEATGCADSTTGYDNYGNAKVVASYKTTSSGQADMTVLEGDRRYMITSKQTVVLSERQDHYTKCEVVPTTIALVDSYKGDLPTYVAAEYRTWEVAKVTDKDHVGDALSTLASFKGKAVNFTFGALDSGRYSLTYTYADNPDNVGGGAYKLWYYPAKQLLVYIGLGQSVSFTTDATATEYYISRIVDSFKLND